MKPSILVVMLDFLVCSLLMFVIGTGGQETRSATSAPAAGVAEEFSPGAMQAQQDEWNRDYEQQVLLTQLAAQTSETEALRGRLTETSATLAAREVRLQALTAEKAQVEEARHRTEASLNQVSSQLSAVSAERARLEKEGSATKEQLSQIQTQLTGLQGEQAKLQQERTELQQRATALGQTVASQQATISTLSEEVRASQGRVETQLAAVAQGQETMGASLADLAAFTRTLPATLRESVAGVHDDQLAMQQNLAALADNVQELQAALDPAERARLLQAMADVSQGQQDLRTRFDDLVRTGGGTGDQFGSSLDKIQAGQEALRQQNVKLGEQIESIKARSPGPFKAVRGARLELRSAITKRHPQDNTVSKFTAVAYPPVVKVGGRSFVVAQYQALGFGWWGITSVFSSPGPVTSLEYTITRRGESPWSAPLAGTACALRADPRVVSIELSQAMPGVETMELAPVDAALASDQRKLSVFKSTAAGLSFEVDAAPDLADARYLVVKRPLRGVAAWLENPAYRAETGDYVVTSDGKLVGIMISREKCFVLSAANLGECATSIGLTDVTRFQEFVKQYPRVK